MASAPAGKDDQATTQQMMQHNLQSRSVSEQKQNESESAMDGSSLRSCRYLHSVTKDEKEDIYYREEGSKKILFFETKIKRISEINTSQETFRCRFHIYLTWLATQSEVNKFEGMENQHDYMPDWIPQIKWANAVHHHRATGEDEAYYKIRDKRSSGLAKTTWKLDSKYFGFEPWKGKWNRVKYEFDVEFAEELHLPSFPFDCQDLTLMLTVDDNGVHQCDIVPFPRLTDFAMFDPEFSVLSEWDFESLILDFGNTDSSKSKAKREHALVGIHIKASRQWQVHIGQMIVTFCMFTLGLGTFAQGLDGEELGNRLGYCVTLLLADVATLQLLFDYLPNIPYFTIFDYYIYASFVFLFCATIWSCVAGAFDALGDLDSEIFYVFLTVYILSHLIFGIMAIVKRIQERQKLIMTSSQLEKLYKKTKTARDRRAISVPWIEENLFKDDKNDEFKPRNILIRGRKTRTNIINAKLFDYNSPGPSPTANSPHNVDDNGDAQTNE